MPDGTPNLFRDKFFKTSNTKRMQSSSRRFFICSNPTQRESIPHNLCSMLKRKHFLPGLFTVELKILQAIQKKIGAIEEHNSRCFGEILFSILMPCVLFHYFAKCGHLKEMNSILTEFVQIVYNTGKLCHQSAILMDLMEKVRMPGEAFNSLYEGQGSCANLTGTNGSFLHNDELLETRSVLPAKQGTGKETWEFVEISF